MDIFSTARSQRGVALVRIIIGLLLVYHGQELFHPSVMSTYLEWDMFKGPAGSLMVYIGKSVELVSGILFLIGLLTRPAALVVIGNFLYITFFVGEGRFWYEDQHPFMFALFGLLFLFTGAGAWSVDGLIHVKKIRS